MYIYNIVIVQSNKVQTCYTRYANIYTFLVYLRLKKPQKTGLICFFLWLFVIGVVFFLKRKEKNNRRIVMKNDELYKVGRKHTGLVCFVVYSK